MSDELYQRAIKDLARAGHGAGRLLAPDASVRLDNPLCGDRISLDLKLEGGHIESLAHETKGCLLCRAAANLLSQIALGRTAADISALDEEIMTLLTRDTATQSLWPQLAVFLPVRPHKSRHECVLLPFRALRQALRSL